MSELVIDQTAGDEPAIIWCGGFKSDMTGGKATALKHYSLSQGWAYTRFDYRGHGASVQHFDQYTISDWLEDTLNVIDGLGCEKYILVGSSMGAWIALLASLQRQNQIAGLLLLAAATDFTSDLIWNRLDEKQQSTIMSQGRLLLPSEYDDGTPYPITRRLIEDGRQHRLLDGQIDILCPVRMIHGTADQDVPWHTSVRTMECLNSDDVRLMLLKNADHRLSGESELAIVMRTLTELRSQTGDA